MKYPCEYFFKTEDSLKRNHGKEKNCILSGQDALLYFFSWRVFGIFSRIRYELKGTYQSGDGRGRCVWVVGFSYCLEEKIKEGWVM